MKHIALFVVMFLVAGALAADWPQWGGDDPGRNMVNSEKGLPESFNPGQYSSVTKIVAGSTTENVRWAVHLGQYIYGNPVVARGKVFVGTDDWAIVDPRLKPRRSGLFRCLDAATGRLIWQLPIPRIERDQLPKDAALGQQHLGICSAAAVDGDRVYLLTNNNILVCMDIDGLADGNDGPFEDEGAWIAGAGKEPLGLIDTDADILWAYDIGRELDIAMHDVASSALLVDEHFVYVNTGNGGEETSARPDAPHLIAVDKMTGKLAAKDEAGIGRRLFHTQWGPPSLGVVNGRKLVFMGGADGFCYAFEALAGPVEEPVVFKEVWRYDANPPHYRIKDGEPIRYLAGDKRKKYTLNKANDGTFLGPSEIIAAPTFYKNRIYVAIGQDPAHGRGRGLLHCIDATKEGDITGTGAIWTFDGIERSLSGVTIADGLAYAADLAGKVYCLDAESGKLYWMEDLKSETWATPLLADGKIYLGAKGGVNILAAGLEPKVLFQVSLGFPSYGTPVAANGTLYVASQQYLWAVQKGARYVGPTTQPSQP